MSYKLFTIYNNSTVMFNDNPYGLLSFIIIFSLLSISLLLLFGDILSDILLFLFMMSSSAFISFKLRFSLLSKSSLSWFLIYHLNKI